MTMEMAIRRQRRSPVLSSSEYSGKRLDKHDIGDGISRHCGLVSLRPKASERRRSVRFSVPLEEQKNHKGGRSATIITAGFAREGGSLFRLLCFLTLISALLASEFSDWTDTEDVEGGEECDGYSEERLAACEGCLLFCSSSARAGTIPLEAKKRYEAFPLDELSMSQLLFFDGRRGVCSAETMRTHKSTRRSCSRRRPRRRNLGKSIRRWLLFASAQLRVLEPIDLYESMQKSGAFTEANHNTLICATATFGDPLHGTRLGGRAYYAPDIDPVSQADGKHCEQHYCDLLKPQQDEFAKVYEHHNQSEKSFPFTRHIFIVDRGNCTFVHKVFTAQKCGADAVVVVDGAQNSNSRADIQRIIMADDGMGFKVNIPSLLISYEDGKTLKEAVLKSTTNEPVILELEWMMPIQWPVQVNLFTDAGNQRGNEFLSEFAQYALVLRGHIRFQPSYLIFYLPADKDEFCLTKDDIKHWADPQSPDITDHDFCALQPVASGLVGKGTKVPDSIKGRDIVLEDLRQLCLLHATTVPDPLVPDGEYSDAFWSYHIMNWSDNKNIGCRFHFPGMESPGALTDCSLRNIRSVTSSNQIEAFQHCLVTHDARNLLERSRGSRAWSSFTFQINGAQLGGTLRVSIAVRAICAALRSTETGGWRAPQCAELLTQLEIHEPWAPYVGIPWSNILVVIFFLFVIAGFLLYIYHRYLRRRMDDSVRETVRSQMKEYYNLDEEPSDEYDTSVNRPLV